MKAQKETITIFTLEMDEEEANWLKDIMRYTLNEVAPAVEDNRDRELRYKFYHALNGV